MTANEDRVGYRNPPKESRFRHGESGNPKGRPKKAATFKSDLTAELREFITIRENGREKRLSKQRAFIKSLMALAIKGDVRAINAIVACTRNFDIGADIKTEDVPADPLELGILEAFIARERRRSQDHESPKGSHSRKKPKKN